jgi:hyperosmotically inducible periplasmic protein
MKTVLLSTLILTSSSVLLRAADLPTETFHTFVDSNICAHLMLGPINESRIKCSVSTAKDGDSPVLVRLQNNMVLTVNQPKKINKLVGQYLQATGQVKVKDGTMKLLEVSPETEKDIPASDRKLLDARQYQSDSKLREKIRHELAMMPYISEFDYVSFTMMGNSVILSGWTVRNTNRSEAYNRIKNIEGVGTIVNNIEVLPMGRNDMDVRAGARGRLQQNLSRYFWGSGSNIKIIVKNGDVILLGTVSKQGDSDLAAIQCNQVRGAFHVFNLLTVTEPAKTASN